MRRFTGGQRFITGIPNANSSGELKPTCLKSQKYEYINPEIKNILYDDLIYFFKPAAVGGKGWTPHTDEVELIETLALYNIITGNEDLGSIPRFPEDSGVPGFNSSADASVYNIPRPLDPGVSRPLDPGVSRSSVDAPVYNSTGSVADLPTRRRSIGGKRRSKKTRRFRR